MYQQWDDPISDDYADGYAYRSPRMGNSYGARRAATLYDMRRGVEPLLEQIRQYDAIRQRLACEGGHVSDFSAIADILSRKVKIRGSYREYDVSLVERSEIRALMSEIGMGELQLDVRLLPNQWPVYYLCRIRNDYWSVYSLVVEDIYMSPDYPLCDERFARLLQYGHESYYLRLSQFRSRVEQCLASDRKEALDTWYSPVDRILYDMGRYVFQAAWHEDQRPGVLAAIHFGMPEFRNAIELLYLCLSGELCELRSAANEKMMQFFKEVYAQPAIHAFLSMLCNLDGEALNRVPQKALKQYSRLSKAFGRFLNEKISCDAWRMQVPVYKIVLGNLYRLDLITNDLEKDHGFARAVERLKTESRAVIGEITGNV